MNDYIKFYKSIKSKIGGLSIVDFIYVAIILKFRKIDISPKPFFASDEAVEYFCKLLANSKYYVEYGAGGSTIYAASINIKMSSYESSRQYMNYVKAKLVKEKIYRPENQTLMVCDYGFTRSWGIPFPVNALFKSRKDKMRFYSNTHWVEYGNIPDLILIDGRFRVACALKAIKILNQYSNWCIVVDDYLGRNEYKVIENFAILDSMIGTTAFFKKAFINNEADIDAAINEYELDYR